MFSAIYWSLFAFSLGGLLPAAVLFAECAAAAWPRRATRAGEAAAGRPSVAVLIPAHDEEISVGQAIEALRPQLASGDRLLVVADNCSDDTAGVARRGGAEVATRDDRQRRGKGHALRFGLDRLREERPPQLVLVVDADCIAEPGALDALARRSAASGRPTQACYLMRPGSGSAISRFAFVVRNQVRPLGLDRLGLPCQLMGTGMAFPWALLERVEPEPANLVEDLQLGADLALAGYPPLYVPGARVTSALPEGRAAASAQRRRWEHGHLQTILRMAPRLLVAGLRQRRLDLLALGADLGVPPLALLAVLLLGVWSAALAAHLAGAGALPLAIASLALGLAAVAVALAWLRHGRSVISGRELLRAPLYAAAKLPLYLDFLWRRQRDWVRTDRER